MGLLAHLLAELLINFVVVVGLSIIVSKTSALSIGHLAFFGIGALSAGYLFGMAPLQYSLPLALGVATGAATVVGLLIAMTTFRLRDDYFLVFSVAVTEVIYGLSLALKGPGGFNALSRPHLGPWLLDNDWYVIGGLLVPTAVIAAALFHRFRQLPLDGACAAVRTNEDFAALLGISPFRVKVGCFLLAAVLTSVAGVLATVYGRATDPNQIAFDKNLVLFATLLFGGLNTISGAALAALLFTLVPIMFESLLAGSPYGAFYGAEIRQLVFGILLLAVIRRLPRGLSGEAVLRSTGDNELI